MLVIFMQDNRPFTSNFSANVANIHSIEFISRLTIDNFRSIEFTSDLNIYRDIY